MTRFEQTLARHQIDLPRRPIEILQINLGKLCNQACTHCHVEAGPKRTEVMDARTIERLIALMDEPTLTTVDLTGGAPELNPHFRSLVTAARNRGLKVIDRCNLTVLFEPGQEDTARFLAASGVNVVASMPCYSRGNVDKQRGKGVFGKSIDGLLSLNELGYGQPGTGLELDLVYNPGGAFLPPAQASLELDYKRILAQDFGIVFNRLFTITNMPIKRWAVWLHQQGKHEQYMQLLVDSFNPSAAAGVMCRNTVSVGYDGRLYDCDFNQMLELDAGNRRQSIWDIDTLADLQNNPIALDDHCFGCTAGAGSSCGGTTAQEAP